jgi:prephenate dehydratase
VENSIAGDVPGCRALVAQHHVRTRKTVALPVVHALVASWQMPVDEVREVHSHPMALAQCRRFLTAHPQMLCVPTFDTAGALGRIDAAGSTCRGRDRVAARGGPLGGLVLLDGIQDRKDNYTEFWLVTPTRLTTAAFTAHEIRPRMC